MSKNGSRSAHKYLGNSWGLSKSHRSNPLIFTKKAKDAILKEAEKKKKLKEKKILINQDFNQLCKQFNIKKRKDDLNLQRIKSKFCSLKDRNNRIAIIKNTTNFKKYCEHFGEVYNLHRYYNLEYYKVNFKQKYPELSASSMGKNLTNKKVSVKSIQNNISSGTFETLMKLKHSLTKKSK